MYLFSDTAIGDDMAKIVENANGRLHWLWQHNLLADLVNVEEIFRETFAS